MNINGTHRMTRAQAARVNIRIGVILKAGLRLWPLADRVMSVSDLAALIAAQEAPVAKRGPYKKKAA